MEADLSNRRIEMEKKIKIKQLEVEAAAHSAPPPPRAAGGFDGSRNIALVPQFREAEVDSYFSAFERVATSLKWPTEVWALLLQCKLTGKAQEILSAL